jgi:hypothetical protein
MVPVSLLLPQPRLGNGEVSLWKSSATFGIRNSIAQRSCDSDRHVTLSHTDLSLSEF